MKVNRINNLKKMFLKYIVFMLPAMVIAAKGFADLWIFSEKQPYVALTLLALAGVMGMMFLTIASALLYLSHRQFWFPPGKLILLTTGMILYFDYSLGNTIGLIGLLVPAWFWILWGLMAYRKNRSAAERS